MTANRQRVGYARVSSIGQNLDSQIDALSSLGCTKIFSDQQSGVSQKRAGFLRLMEYIREGDSLVVTELSRLSRSLAHLLTVVESLEEKGVEIVSLRENIDTQTATGRCFLSMMGAIAQMERELKSERAWAGRQAAKARGRTGGRPKTQLHKLEQAKILYQNSDKTAKEVCQAIGIGRRTLFRYLAQERKQQPC